MHQVLLIDNNVHFLASEKNAWKLVLLSYLLLNQKEMDAFQNLPILLISLFYMQKIKNGSCSIDVNNFTDNQIYKIKYKK
jgi:hypothetical protein